MYTTRQNSLGVFNQCSPCEVKVAVARGDVGEIGIFEASSAVCTTIYTYAHYLSPALLNLTTPDRVAEQEESSSFRGVFGVVVLRVGADGVFGPR